MSILSGSGRRLLEGVVVAARDVVESACAQRIASLGVADDRVPDALSEEERRLRRGLRARVRQLGSVEALVAEAAFEHWHRMLFARFVADNGLLVDDVAGQPVSVDELGEIAAELGESDRWEVAARFASAMLPGIFRADDPVLAMRLPVEARQRLEELLGSLPREVFSAEDALGWVYQYWQSRRKDEVNRSERKIGGADLAPVTQLFTENYMVRFLLENSLGAWWAARHPDSSLLGDWEYLRFTEDGNPAAGSFAEWPHAAAGVTVMDPCCGSGHFLVAAFGMLWRMRVEEEGLPVAQAQDAVLRENLFGLELDPRCTQIAVFALALEAWKSGGYRVLPVPHVACSGIPAKAPLSDWTTLAGGDQLIENALVRLHSLFANADTLGSLIDPVRAAEDAGLESVDWHQVGPLVQQALTRESGRHGGDATAAVFGEAAAGIARAADYLSGSYTLIATNVPYLGRGKFGPVLTSHSEGFPDAAGDLAALMMERCFSLGKTGSRAGIVSPQSWVAQSGFRRLRTRWFSNHGWPVMARLGGGAFAGISGEVVQVLLTVNSLRTSAKMSTVDVSDWKGPEGKAGALRAEPMLVSDVGVILGSREVRPNFAPQQTGLPLRALASAGVGIQTGDNEHFTKFFWEFPACPEGWVTMSRAPSGESTYSGATRVLLWEDGRGALYESVKQRLGGSVAAWIRGLHFWEGRGVLLSRMGDLPAALYPGGAFADNCMVIAPGSESDLPALWAFAESGELAAAVRAVDKTLSVTPGSVLGATFDAAGWRAVATRRFPDGLPEPQSLDATQWLFRAGVTTADQPLQVAVSRLLGFSWPHQSSDGLQKLADPDGVVCLPAVGGEGPAVDRVLEVLSRSWGDAWSPRVLDELLEQVGAGAGKAGLDTWLRGGFFKDHCRLFGNRPFIWHIWDGTPDGFSALINYHRLDRQLLERLAHDFLGSWWMGKVREEVAREVPGAAKRLAAAEVLQGKLVKILEGEPPFDIFVRWKSLAEQPVGWDPDLDDGVRMNIRPFMTADVLRAKPNIKWGKDRGTNHDGSERLNDLHYTLAEKRAARGDNR